MLDELNKVHDKKQFTVEEETDGCLPFLGTMVIRSDKSAQFHFYRKPTNKDDFIHFFSAHDDRTKSGVVIGFFPRALRICSPEYLDDEFQYIIVSFKQLKYPTDMLTALKQKAIKIKERNKGEVEPNTRFLVVPNSSFSCVLSKALRPTGLIIVNDTASKIGSLVKHRNTPNRSERSIIYKIPCCTCDLAYYGESSRGLDNRLKEHKADVRHHRTTNALVHHIDKEGTYPTGDIR